MNMEARAHHERIEAQKLILAQLRQGEKLRKTECEVSGILGKGSRLAPTVEQLRNCYGFIISGDGSFKNPYRLDDVDQLPTKLKLTKEIQDAYYKSDHWRKTRETRRQQDGGCCVTCKTDLSLECHHLTYENLFCEEMRDLQSLCSECHKRTHANGKLKFPSGMIIEHVRMLGFQDKHEEWLLPQWANGTLNDPNFKPTQQCLPFFGASHGY